jgi:hypothetical protein
MAWYLRSLEPTFLADAEWSTRLSGRIPDFLARISERFHEPQPNQTPLITSQRLLGAVVRTAYDVGTIRIWRDLVSFFLEQEKCAVSVETLSHLVFITELLEVLPRNSKRRLQKNLNILSSAILFSLLRLGLNPLTNQFFIAHTEF